MYKHHISKPNILKRRNAVAYFQESITYQTKEDIEKHGLIPGPLVMFKDIDTIPKIKEESHNITTNEH